MRRPFSSPFLPFVHDCSRTVAASPWYYRLRCDAVHVAHAQFLRLAAARTNFIRNREKQYLDVHSEAALVLQTLE